MFVYSSIQEIWEKMTESISGFFNLMDFPLIDAHKIHITLLDIFFAVLFLIISQLVVRLLLRGMRRQMNKNPRFDKGQIFSLTQIVRYSLYVAIIIVALDLAGISIAFLLAGSTALLLGIGFGLQDTFKDFIAGIVILIEGSMHVEDVVVVDDTLGRVVSIGFRATKLLTRDNIIVTVPNSRILGNHMTNMSAEQRVTRFDVKVGVAYGSNTELVREVLLACAKAHDMVLKEPAPAVWFEDFGDSSLDFRLMFWSEELFRIEKVRGDLRYAIDKAFRENNITIPFPQRDLWVKEFPTGQTKNAETPPTVSAPSNM